MESETLRLHRHFQSIETEIFVSNVDKACQIGSLLYLNPTTVLQFVDYWWSEWNNALRPSQEWFDDIVEGILFNPPVIEIHGQFGLRYEADNNAAYALLLKVMGSELHRVPHVHFITRNNQDTRDRENPALIKALAYILNAENKCFLHTHAPGLKSQLQATTYLYDTILEEFFEPSFIIMTCYLTFINYLNRNLVYNVLNGQTKMTKKKHSFIQLDVYQHKIELLKRSIQPLEKFIEIHESLFQQQPPVDDDDDVSSLTECQKDEIIRKMKVYKCIDYNDNTRVEKVKRLAIDLGAIVMIIKEGLHSNYQSIQPRIKALWSKKMAYCTNQMHVRTGLILSKLDECINNK